MPSNRTYLLWCAIQLEATFPLEELEPDLEGAVGDLAPTDAALGRMSEEIRAVLRGQWRVTELELEVDVSLDGGEHGRLA